MGIRQIFGANLKKLRRSRGLSQEELAYRAEIDRTYVSALERGVYSATIDIVERIAKVLKVEAAELLRNSERPYK
jgi:transcriptional regulator with XRE-family HTH domain